MNNKFLKSISCILLTVSMFFSLTACGNSNNEANLGINTPNDTLGKINSASKCFISKPDSIWYKTASSGGGKDTKVAGILIFQNGEGRYYNYEDLGLAEHTLGEFAKMTDTEIISMVEQDYTEFISNKQTQLANNCVIYKKIVDAGEFSFEGDTYPMGTEKQNLLYSSISSLQEFQYSTKVSTADCEVSIYTNETGNETSYMNLIITYLQEEDPYIQHVTFTIDPIYDIERVSEHEYKNISIEYKEPDPTEQYIEFSLNSGLSEPFTIYNSLYNGFICDGLDFFLLTRVENDETFCLDKVGTPGIEVDPTEDYSTEDYPLEDY